MGAPFHPNSCSNQSIPIFFHAKKGRLKPYINQVSDDLFNLIRQPQNIFFMAF